MCDVWRSSFAKPCQPTQRKNEAGTLGLMLETTWPEWMTNKELHNKIKKNSNCGKVSNQEETGRQVTSKDTKKDNNCR